MGNCAGSHSLVDNSGHDRRHSGSKRMQGDSHHFNGNRHSPHKPHREQRHEARRQSSDKNSTPRRQDQNQPRLDRFNQPNNNSNSDSNVLQRRQNNGANRTVEEDVYNALVRGDNNISAILKGVPMEKLLEKHKQPPRLIDMDQVQDPNHTFLIKPFRHAPVFSDPPEPRSSAGNQRGIVDYYDNDHVHMPYSQSNRMRNNRPIWPVIVDRMQGLKSKCDNRSATFDDLKRTMHDLTGIHYDLTSLEILIEDKYNNQERLNFMSTVLSNICQLVFTLDSICPEAPPLLRCQSNRSVTMSQHQAAALLACAFFCLFPDRSNKEANHRFERFPNPNFNRLYEKGSSEKIEKLKCILHYFTRVAKKIPTGVITFQRFALSQRDHPRWNELNTNLGELSLSTGQKIEDIKNVLQVDFANKYIGGGVLGNGCVQEEIRFTICPEMLVSLLVCEVMEDNECVFLIGCERYSKYRGYAQSFEFDGDYSDYMQSDSWGRKWSHLVAIDAIFFRDKSTQYEMNLVNRELNKAYTGFRSLNNASEYHYAIATGNWGCGAFNGDRQLKAIIQWMAASEAQRPLIYAAFADRNLVEAFNEVQLYLKNEGATIGDLYWYLMKYSRIYDQCSLFEFILQNPVKKFRK